MAATQDLWRNVQQIWMPVLVLAAGPAAELMRFTRSSMLTTLQQEYVRTARAKGLLERQIVMVHAARTALLPVLTVLGLQVGGIIAESVVMEVLFNLPGLGSSSWARSSAATSPSPSPSSCSSASSS